MRTPHLALLACLSMSSAAHAQAPADLETWNRQFNEHHQITSVVLPWSREGKPSWDCKGLVFIKAKALERAGYRLADMRVLVAHTSDPLVDHDVLVVNGMVLDEGGHASTPDKYLQDHWVDAATWTQGVAEWNGLGVEGGAR